MSKRKKFYSIFAFSILVVLAFYSYPVLYALLDKSATPPEYLMSPIKAKPRSKVIQTKNKSHLPVLEKELQNLYKKDISIALLERYSSHQDAFIRQQVACHPKTPLAIIKKLITDKDSFVLQQILGRSDINSEMLAKLAQNKDWFIRQIVASHLKTPEKTLFKLSNDRQMEVRWAVAKNPHISLKVFEKLCQDAVEVKRQLVLNVNVPKNILQKLSSEEDKYIKRIALEKLHK